MLIVIRIYAANKIVPIVMQIHLNNEDNQNSAREGIAEWNKIKGLHRPLTDNLQAESIKDPSTE